MRWLYFLVAGAARRRARLPAARPARAAPAGDGAPLLPRDGGRRGRARSRSGSSRSCCAPRTRSSCRSGGSSTATFPRRERHALRDGVRRDDPRLRARQRARLPRLADRPRVAALAGLRARRSASPSGLSLSGHSAVDARLVLALGARRLGAPGGRLALGRRPRAARASSSGRSSPTCGAGAFLRFSRLATVLIVVILGAGIYLSVLRLPQLDDLWARALRPGAAGQARARLARAALGRGTPLPRAPALERGAPLFAALPRSLAGESAVGMAILLGRCRARRLEATAAAGSAAAPCSAGALDAAGAEGEDVRDEQPRAPVLPVPVD